MKPPSAMHSPPTDSDAPLVLMVAPNGAYKTHADHPELPLTPDALALTARHCLEAGASMLHLHVRDREGRHVLEAQAYQDAIHAIRQAVGNDLIIQITSEAAQRYHPSEQMAVVRAVHPEAVSVALRELVPDAASETAAAPFFEWLHREGIMTQFILYSREELARFLLLRQRGLLPATADSVLFVLGRYRTGQHSDPQDLLPFLETLGNQPLHWAVCAFGAQEAACLTAAMTLSGHVRTGFENNLRLPGGELARDNAQLVDLIARQAQQLGRPLARADHVRALWAWA